MKNTCNRGHSSGHYKNGECRDCCKMRSRLFYKNNRERVLERSRAIPAEIKKETARRNRLLRVYGISIDDFKALLEKQNFRCAICKAPIPDIYDCDVDHCHKTGVVRGILCRPCNLLLGYAKDDVQLLQSAAKYLQSVKL